MRTFATHAAVLQALADWLVAEGVTHAALESTGVYWKLVFNLLEGRVAVLLVNAQHIKQIPGRKTEVTDCAWIGQLLRHGLLTASFIPPARQRELRDLTRQRSQLGAERTGVANRIQNVLEDATIKLASVASDVLGASGRAMLEALIAGQEDPEQLADLARRRLRAKIPELRQALRGRVTDRHRFLLRLLLEQLDHLDQFIGQLSARVEELTAPDAAAMELLVTIPRVKQQTADVLLAEVGPTGGPVPECRAVRELGGAVPGEQRERGQAADRADPAREPVAVAGGRPGRLGGVPHEGDVPQHPLPAGVPAARAEAGAAGAGAHAPGDRGPCAAPAGRLPGARRRPLRPAAARTADAAPGPPAGATRPQGGPDHPG